MSLELRFAPSADLLLKHLSTSIKACWMQNPLQSPMVVVPNPAVKRWLTLRMAQQMESVLGLSLNTLERAIWDWLRPDAGMERLQAQDLQIVIAHVLNESLLATNAFTTVRVYLQGLAGIDPVKRMQLAGYLARLFQEYEFNRPSVWDREKSRWALPGLDASWLTGKPYDFTREVSDLVRAQERWQSELYRRVQCTLQDTSSSIVKASENFSPRMLLSLPQLLTLRRSKSLDWRVAPGHYYLFLVSKISHWHRNLLVDISQMPGVQLHVYLTNPCAEFWEDVDTWGAHTRRVRWNSQNAQTAKRGDPAGIAKRQPSDYQREEMSADFFDSTDPKLLELWGHSARENVALWCADADWDFEYHRPPWVDTFTGTESLSCLKALQLSLLRRESNLHPGTQQDKSLQIIAAPTLGREMEELREQILTAVQDKSIESLEDVVIYVTDLSSYLPHIHRVFGAYRPWDPEYMGYNLFGAPGGGSLYAQAVQAVLALVEGRYDRASIFTLLRNPIWQASHRVQASEVAIWETWAANTGMIRGFDHEHRAAMGDKGSAASDIHTFGLGESRLLVGNLVSGPVDLGYVLPIEGYRDFETSSPMLLERFLAALEDIHLACTQWKESELADSLARLLQLLESWIPNLPVEKEWNPMAEGKVRKQFLDSLQSLQEMALHTNYGIVSKAELLAWVRNCLPAELPTGSKAWLGGVTFAPLRMGMVLPHKMVCVLGLGAKEFPGVSNPSVLDLLTVVRKVGDSRPVRDNQLTFLELVHAARERLVLSWRAQNLQKEEELQPSSVLLELMDVLKSQGITSKRTLPLSTWEALVNPTDSSSKELNWSKSQLSLASAAKEPRATWRFSAEQGLAIHQKGLLAEEYTLSELQSFFTNPLEYHLKQTLSLRGESAESALDISDEPLESTALVDAAMQKELWIELLTWTFPQILPKPAPTAQDFDAFLIAATDRIIAQRTIRGELPLAPLDQKIRNAMILWAKDRSKHMPKVQKEFPDHYFVCKSDLSAGRAKVPARLSIEAVQILVSNSLLLIPRNSAGSVAILDFSKGSAEQNPKLWMRGILHALFEQTLPQSLQYKGFRLLNLNRKVDTASMYSWLDLKSWHNAEGQQQWERMRTWLAHFVQALRHGEAEHLPQAAVQSAYEFAQKLLEQDPSMDCGDLFSLFAIPSVLQRLELEADSFVSYNENWSLVEHRIPSDPQRVVALAQARFAPLLEKWVHG